MGPALPHRPLGFMICEKTALGVSPSESILATLWSPMLIEVVVVVVVLDSIDGSFGSFFPTINGAPSSDIPQPRLPLSSAPSCI
uniref:Uncharacterized protein n=1 Tax=Zea mays TaxID=4577 RepID=C0PA58_MAIZE|nr:unknown [Zea mays]